ncbi:MAG: hypothetical protein SFU25_09075 [Candidatus Caenarcaniphilales bacterium]|nr:hypothetical protein [Candidatus Caenarcaniphilales bacterium]
MSIDIRPKALKFLSHKNFSSMLSQTSQRELYKFNLRRFDLSKIEPSKLLENINSFGFKQQILQAYNSNEVILISLTQNLSKEDFVIFMKCLFGRLRTEKAKVVYDFYDEPVILSPSINPEIYKQIQPHTDFISRFTSFRGSNPIDNPSCKVSCLFFKEIPLTGGILQIHKTAQCLEFIKQNFPESFKHLFDADAMSVSSGSKFPILYLDGFGQITLQLQKTGRAKQEAQPAFNFLIDSSNNPAHCILIKPRKGDCIIFKGGVIHQRSQLPEPCRREVWSTFHHNLPDGFNWSLL